MVNSSAVTAVAMPRTSAAVRNGTLHSPRASHAAARRASRPNPASALVVACMRCAGARGAAARPRSETSPRSFYGARRLQRWVAACDEQADQADQVAALTHQGWNWVAVRALNWVAVRAAVQWPRRPHEPGCGRCRAAGAG